MILKYVTCSGVDEQTNIDDLLSLAMEYPLLEIGIQVSEKRVTDNPAFFDWIMALHEKASAQEVSPNIVLQVTDGWVKQFASRALIPELDYFLSLDVNLGNKTKSWFVKRLQVNVDAGDAYRVDFGRFCQAMTDRAVRPVILPYNDNNAVFVNKLYKKGIKFDCLYHGFDDKSNAAIMQKAPAFKDRVQGYAGGLSAENVKDRLQNLRRFVDDGHLIYIEAEDSLKDKNGHFDLQKCQDYLFNVMLSGVSYQQCRVW